MNVHFGVVKEYFPQKGFGFVAHPLESEMRKDVFFHISNVQKYNKDIANKLSSYEPGDDIYFYYEAENTPKGYQVKSILPTEGIRKLLEPNLDDFFVKLLLIWSHSKLEPIWLHEVTQDLFSTDQLNSFIISKQKQKEREEINRKEKEKIEKKRLKQLEIQRKEKERIEAEKQNQLEIQRRERERIEAERQKQRELKEHQRRIEAEERERQRKIEHEARERQRKIVADEFELLVAEMKPKGFTKSWQVSNYIVSNRLGDKYKHLSGVLLMEGRGSSWKFNGGISPDVYAELCQRLELGNKETDSRVVGFTAYKDL